MVKLNIIRTISLFPPGNCCKFSWSFIIFIWEHEQLNKCSMLRNNKTYESQVSTATLQLKSKMIWQIQHQTVSDTKQKEIFHVILHRRQAADEQQSWVSYLKYVFSWIFPWQISVKWLYRTYLTVIHTLWYKNSI